MGEKGRISFVRVWVDIHEPKQFTFFNQGRNYTIVGD